MKKQSHLSLLIFCAVLSQAIIADLLNEDLEVSSHLHIRQKRVINIDKEDGSTTGAIRIESAPYIVGIRRDNQIVCAGNILSAVFVLSLRTCVLSPGIAMYTIISGSAIKNNGTVHTIKNRIVVAPNQKLALYKVSPHFDFDKSSNKPIPLFLGFIPHIKYGIFSGWGCTRPGGIEHVRLFPPLLIKARLPIIPLEQCIDIYLERYTITNKNICTLDETKRRGTCVGDEGGPLALSVPPLMVVHLVGVSLFRGAEFGKDPDVFVNLNHQEINEWITHVINTLA